ncbi:MAG TPA: NADPH:quinone oxidoreductase family protein [Acidimicrobiales bacterium]|nr:NADPH:quinone oxidoreductase family protein [Acidimicrobiales bacterium]
MTTMRAWRVHGAGEPRDVLQLDTLPAQVPGRTEVVVSVEGAALGFPDVMLCEGTYHHKPARPFTLGCEAVGTVVRAGEGAEGWLGRRVIVAPLSYGCLAEEVLVGSQGLLPVPDTMPTAAAASLFMAYQTSAVALERRARLAEGDTLVVFGATGGVGSAAVQLGRAMGAQVVGVVGSPAKADACARNGVDRVVDASCQDVVDAVLERTSGRGADVVFDPVGGALFDAAVRCTAVEGRIVAVGFASGVIPSLSVNRALMKNFDVIGFRLQPYREDFAFTRQVHDDLLGRFTRGEVDPVIDAECSLGEVPEALADLKGRGVTGRKVVVLQPSGDATTGSRC